MSAKNLRIKLFKPTTTRDDYGEEVEAFTEAGEVWAADEPLSLRSTSAVLGVGAGALNAPDLRWMTVRVNQDIQPGWRVARTTGRDADKQLLVIAVRASKSPLDMHLIARLQHG
ncbi:head-tail adaptor protein [uncultured Stenotrophomonas sp.]|uniref:head-tail adaptor protein n=1 Tax=uncultured Stenotrophomonas sp. TaxID=165438 RepID=UPI0025E1C8D6|nr:head-tail adaptor protein [uncultured Stenotrophomonas sp.]